MGIPGFGPKTRTIKGEVFVCQAEFAEADRQTAELWKKEYHRYGFKCHIEPNAQNRCYEIWVSEFPTLGANEVKLIDG